MPSAALEAILHREGVTHDAIELFRQSASVVALSTAGNSTRLICALAAEIDAEPRQLALDLAAQIAEPLDPVLVPWLRPLLRDRRLDRGVRTRAANVLLRSANLATALRVLRDFAAGFGRVRLLRHSRKLRREFGNPPAFDRFCERLRRTIPLRCPRCKVKRSPTAMVRHLWRRHRRLLDGRQVRSAWDWLDQRLGQLPVGAEPTDAIVALQRYLRRWKLKDDQFASVLAAVDRRGACLCPHCATRVAVPKVEPVQPLTVSRGRVAGNGFVLQIAETPFRPHLRVEMPTQIVHDGPEPDAGWSRVGASRRLVLPLVILAVVLSATLPPGVALLGSAGALAVAYALRLLVRAHQAPNITERAIDHAWRLLDEHDSHTMARLAAASIGHGDPNLRESALDAALQRATDVADRAALIELQVSDSRRLGRDPVAVFVNGLAPVFAADAPLSLAELLLAQVPWRRWPASRKARLRIALLARAFEAEIGVWIIHELGRALPPLGELLQADDIDGLARLRLLWTLRADRPWQHCGTAATVFEIADYPSVGEEPLAAAPDLLLSVAQPGAGTHGAPSPVLLGAKGLRFRGALLTAPAPITVAPRPAGRGYDLIVGPHRFRYRHDPAAVAAALRDWADYLFRDLLPHTDAALGPPDGARLERLLESKMTACPKCRGLFRT